MDINLIVKSESFEEIKKRQNQIIENLAKTKEAFRTNDYLDKELTWNRSDNSYYDNEGQKMNMGP